MMKFLRSVSVFLLSFLVACSPATASSTSTAQPTQTIAPTATVQPTVAPPESITSQMGALASRGFELIEDDVGWVLVTKEGKIVLRTDGESIFIETENGQLIEYPASSFDVVETIGVIPLENGETVSSILEMDVDEDEYMFLDTIAAWVIPLELQTNPENPSSYTEISLEDMWNGRVMYSELLEAEPFPEGTIVPEEFIYAQARNFSGNDMQLIPRLEGEVFNFTDHGYQESVNQNNDYRKWIAFYRLQINNSELYDGEDTEILVGTEQILSPDENTSLLVHYGFGPEWSLDKDYELPNGNKENLIDSVFLSRESPNDSDAERYLVNPVVEFGGGLTNYSHVVEEDGSLVHTAGMEFYFGELGSENNVPWNILDGLKEQLKATRDKSFLEHGFNYVVAGDEIYKLQYMFLIGAVSELPPRYFSVSTD